MTPRLTRLAGGLLAVLVAALLLIAAGCGDDDDGGGAGAIDNVPITLADKGFTESAIVTQAYARALESAGFDVTVESLASTEIADKAIRSGDIDLYPEYTGTAYLTVLGEDAETAPDTYEAVFEQVRDAYAQRGLTALPPAPYNNGNEVACTQETVDELDIATLSDLGEKSGEVVYSANAEHLTRPDGLPLLEKDYGVDFKDVRTVDISLRYQPIEDGQAQCVYAFGTDPQIATLDLVVLEDDKGTFSGKVPFQNFAVVNTDFYDQEGVGAPLAEAIASVDALLTQEAMPGLIAQVDFDKEEPGDVAEQFLKENGVID